MNPSWLRFFVLFELQLIFIKVFWDKLNTSESRNAQNQELIFSTHRQAKCDFRHLNLWVDMFRTIASKHKTDKISTHNYQNLYGRYLGPIRFEPLNFLEIGLGCTMGYGPGKSLLAWREFLPNANISILEYDGVCAEKFRHKVEHLFIGDQSNFKVLENIGTTAGPFDFIVDDGGHSRLQQVSNFIYLNFTLFEGS